MCKKPIKNISEDGFAEKFIQRRQGYMDNLHAALSRIHYRGVQRLQYTDLQKRGLLEADYHAPDSDDGGTYRGADCP